jgi:hypothetical protein
MCRAVRVLMVPSRLARGPNRPRNLSDHILQESEHLRRYIFVSGTTLDSDHDRRQPVLVSSLEGLRELADQTPEDCYSPRSTVVPQVFESKAVLSAMERELSYIISVAQGGAARPDQGRE